MKFTTLVTITWWYSRTLLPVVRDFCRCLEISSRHFRL